MALSKENLLNVRKPARYVGGETNCIVKIHGQDRLSFALAYPDIYEIGMSNLGVRIIYHLLNERDDVVCERFFAPWDDMEKELIDSGQKLFTLETKKEVREYDIVGFSLAHELTYTNVLNMLHLSGITVLSEKRKDDEPIVIAGGTCAFNPGPMSAFIDVFFIGDAEDALYEFIDKYKSVEGFKSRKDKLLALSELEGVFVPALYRRNKKTGGRYIDLSDDSLPGVVNKLTVKDLDKSYYPVKQIVPYIKIVHDRIMLEIMRGCPNKCRFCQARMINGPVRIRKPETIKRLCSETYRNTGYSNISLLSLSSVNYPGIAELIKDMVEIFSKDGVGISIPSLRVDKAFFGIPEVISSIRKAGLTFAPETADSSLQEMIGKITDKEILCKASEDAFKNGWKNLKLYFMVGFPKELDGHCDNILSWAKDLFHISKTYCGNRSEIKLSVNPFIPKPHTPFQWVGMRDEPFLYNAKEHLYRNKGRRLKLDFHDIKKSFLEGALSRGDFGTSSVIYSAWKKGARMDAWTEHFNIAIWEQAYSENGRDLYSDASRAYSIDDPLPWDFIRTDIDNVVLREEFRQAGIS